MPDTTTYTRCMPANPKPTKILVYAWYMQRPFRFNLAILTAKNLACVTQKSTNSYVNTNTTIGKGEYMSGIL